jgi:signal transduction histidine kinase
MAAAQDTSFARLTSLAVHDLRTPLATIFGFARTMQRGVELEPPVSRYVEMIIAASEQLTELLEQLGLAARIAGDRYEPVLAEVDTLELARAAVPDVEGTGATITTDPPTIQRALSSLAECARRHGGVDAVSLHVDGAELTLAPVTRAAAPVIMGEELKDLGAAVAVRSIRALSGSVELVGDELRIRLTEGAATAAGP